MMQKIKPARDVQGLEVVLGGWQLSGFYTSSKGKTHEVIQLFGTFWFCSFFIFLYY